MPSAHHEPTPTPERTALYRLYDGDDRLLYVGITSSPKTRMAQHQAEKEWWSEVVTREVEWFETRDKAAAAEVTAIRKERPAHNHKHNSEAVLALLPVAPSDPLRPRLKLVDSDERAISQQMAADLRALIMSGEVAVGGRLPPTSDLKSRYGISSASIQAGLRHLKNEGFAVGKAGSAVYATSPTLPRLEDPSAHETQSLESGEAAPPAWAATALGVPPDSEVWRERHLLRVDGWPLRLVTTYRTLSAGSATAVEEVDRVTVRVPTSRELVTLQLSEETPVMCIFRTVLGDDNLPLEVQEVIEPGHLCQRQYRTPTQPACPTPT